MPTLINAEAAYQLLTRPSPCVGLMLNQRLRRWPKIKPAQGKRLLVSGSARDGNQREAGKKSYLDKCAS